MNFNSSGSMLPTADCACGCLLDQKLEKSPALCSGQLVLCHLTERLNLPSVKGSGVKM